MLQDMPWHFAVGSETGGDDEAHLALSEDVRRPVLNAGLGAGVGHHLESETRGEPGRHGPGVADPPFQVVQPSSREATWGWGQ